MPVFTTVARIRTMTGLQRSSDVVDQDISDAIDRAEADRWLQGGGSASLVVADNGSFVPLSGAGRTHFISACEYQAAAEVMTTWVAAPNVSKVQLWLKLAEDKIYLFRQTVAAFSPGKATGAAD